MKKYTISLVAVAAAATFALASCKKDSVATTTVEPTDTTTEVTPTTTAETVDADTIAKSIIITNNGDKVSADFDLPASVVYNNQAYKITWSTESEYLTFDYPEDDEETKDVDESVSGSVTAKVTRPDIEDDFVVANFTATVEVDGKTGTQSFKVRILRALTPEEERNNFYNGDTTAISFKGVVLFKAGYNTSYNEGNVYVYTEAGNFYVYNGYISQAEYDTLVPGQTVSVTGATVSPYNGWVETKYGSTITVEDDAVVDVSEYLVAEDVTAILAASLNDSAAKADLLFKQNAMAKVSGARFVESYADDFNAASTSSSQSLAKFEVNGKTVLVSIGGIVDYASETATAAVAAVKAMTVGNYYDLTGMLTWYNACDIVVTGTDFAAEASIPDWAAPEEAMKGIEIAAAYVEDTNVTLTVPADVNLAVTIKEDTTSATYDEATKTLTFKPTDTEETVTVVVTITKGDYFAVEEYSVSLKLRTPEEMLEIEAEALENVEMYANSSYAFAETGTTFDSVSISYALKEAHDFTDIDEDVITVTSIDEDFTVTVVATLTCNEATTTKEITVTVTNPTIVDIVVNQPVDGQSYKLGLYQPKANPAGYYYFAGDVNENNYLLTTQDYSTATDVKVTKNDDDTYYLSFTNAAGATKYLALTDAGKQTISDSAYKWTFNTKYNTFTADITAAGVTTTYYIGTYNSFTTFSASKISYISTSYPSNLLVKKEYKYSRQQKIDYEKEKVTVAAGKSGTTVALPSVTLFDDVTITYAVAEADASKATVTEDGLVIGTIADTTTVTLTATIECGGITDTKEITINVAPIEYSTISDIYANVAKDSTETLYVKGIITKIVSTSSYTNVFLSDGTNEFELYGLSSSTKLTKDDIAVGDVIYAYGTASYFASSSLWETANATAVIVKKEAATDDEKIAITKSELATTVTYDEDGEYTLASVGTIFPGAEISWTKDGVTLTDNKLTVTQTSEDQTFTLVATIICGDGTAQTQNVVVTIAKVSLTKTKSVSKGNGTEWKDADENAISDVSSYIGLPDIFTVTYTHTGTYYSKNAESYLQIYKGCLITIKIDSGYTIDSITMTATASKYATPTVTDGTNTLTDTDTNTTDFVYTYTVSGDTVVISAATNQLRLSDVTITYTKTVTE